MPRQLITIIIVLASATVSCLLWRYEFIGGYLAQLKYLFKANFLFPLTAIPISFLITLSLILTISLFADTQKIKNYILSLLTVFGLTVILFYTFSNIFYEGMRGWIKIPEELYLFAALIIIPLYALLTVLIINRLLIKTKKKFIFWLWAAIVLTIPLGLLCLYLFDRDGITRLDILYAVQKGYPVFWINLTIPLTAYIYFKRQQATP